MNKYTFTCEERNFDGEVEKTQLVFTGDWDSTSMDIHPKYIAFLKALGYSVNKLERVLIYDEECAENKERKDSSPSKSKGVKKKIS